MSEKLSNFAVCEEMSKGRVYACPRHLYRSDFERDRDRIIHCSAFRRLEGKSQVFTPGQDDYYRTRATHTIEVSQIGRTIAKALGLNETLTEAICLAHDLGHSPFGHSGESALNKLMSDFGGFEHNRQTVRVVELLEHPYPDFAGLNLMYETRLGLSRHRSPYDKSGEGGFDEKNCSLEGQAADLADRIAYNCHDVEDGMRSRLIGEEKLSEIAIFCQARGRVKAGSIDDVTVRRTRTAKTMIDMLVGDSIEASREAIEKAGVRSVEDVYGYDGRLIRFSDGAEEKLSAMEGFLLQNFYMHEAVREVSDQVYGWVGQLFGRICADAGLMPGYFQRLAADEGLERTVCDYIAGMTDRFCLKVLGSNK